jgi:hypothetical protein
MICVLLLSLQAYISIVQTVGCFRQNNILKSVTLKGSRNTSANCTFAVGDTLTLAAESDVGEGCRFMVYRDSSLVFEKYARFAETVAEALLPLLPPKLGVGKYVVIFDAFVYNKPLFGAEFSDRRGLVFEVTSVETRIEVGAVYDAIFGSLEMCTNLTDREGYPVQGENVSFKIKSADRERITDGWFPLGSSQTDSNGYAALKLAFGMSDGNYSVMAFHASNANFGESKNKTRFEAVSSQGGSLGQPEGGEGFGSLTVSIDNTSPYAVLPVNVRASYVAESVLEGWVGIYFFLDSIGGLHLGGVMVGLPSYPKSSYEASLPWSPNVTGWHKVVAAIVNGTLADVQNCIGIIATGEASVNVRGCPSNLVIQCPSAVYGDVLPVTVAFSKPRCYSASFTDFYAASTLGPKLVYDGLDYVIDYPICSTSLRLYVNSSSQCSDMTGEDGCVVFPMSLGSYGSSFTLEIAVSVEPSSELFGFKFASQIVNFSRVNVQEVRDGGYHALGLSFGVGDAAKIGNKVYINTANPITAKTSVFGLPLCGAPVLLIVGRTVADAETVQGWAAVPSGADYLHVIWTREGTRDACIKARFDTGEEAYLDGKLCARVPAGVHSLTLMRESGSGGGGGGGGGKYVILASVESDQTVVGSRLGTSSLGSLGDIGGFAVSENAGVPIDGCVRFLELCLDDEVATDNVGSVAEVWQAQEFGSYLVQVKLPSEFDVTVTFRSDLPEIYDLLNFIKYYEVVKRPVSIDVDLQGEVHSEVFEAEADAYVDNWFGNENVNFGGNTELNVLRGEPLHEMSYVRLNISSLPSNAYIVSARLRVFCDTSQIFEPASTFCAYMVTSPWNEMEVTWNNRPSNAPNPSDAPYVERGTYEKWLCFDVSECVRSWLNGSANFGLVLDCAYGESAFLVLSSRHCELYVRPALEVSYVLPSPNIAVTVRDGVTQDPLPSWLVTLHADDETIWSDCVNSSGVGVCSTWRPTSSTRHYVTASSDASGVYDAGSASLICDFRFRTNVTFQGANPFEARTGFNNTYSFLVASNGRVGLGGVLVRFFINGTLLDGMCYKEYRISYADGLGFVSFVWAPPTNGTYVIKASYFPSGFPFLPDYSPCETFVCVTAITVPLAVLFSVSRSEFEVGAGLNLNATVLYASNNSRVNNGYVINVGFWNCSSDGTVSFVGSVAAGNGEAILYTTYPNDGKAHAFMAKVIPEAGAKIPQGIVCSPVQLTVLAENTKLLLNVTREESSSKHSICGWLKTGAGLGVSGKQVKIKVNDTEFLPSPTNASGYFSTSIDFAAKDNQPTLYMITASFEDTTQPLQATAWAYTLDGDPYAACTTIQYGYKPAANSTMLTVEPQSTTTMAITKSPEEMKRQAENSGWFWVEPEFSWWFPWFRLHYRLDVNLPQGNPEMDYGWSPLPLGESSDANSTALANIINDATEGSDPWALAEFFGVIAIPFIIQAAAAHFLGRTVAGIAWATAFYGAFLALYSAVVYVRADGNPKAWLMAFMSAAFVEMATLFLPPCSGVVGIVRFLTTGGRLVLGKIQDSLQALHALKLGFFAITGAIFALMDFAVMVFYLSMYLQSI